MNDNIAIVRAFIQAWERLDPVELASYFHEAGCYHNIPAKPVTGRAAVQQFITGFIKTWTQTDWEILTLIGEGEVVVCERIDRTRTQNGDVDLPCCGVFLMEDGKIKLWRDYFDMGTYISAMSG